MFTADIDVKKSLSTFFHLALFEDKADRFDRLLGSKNGIARIGQELYHPEKILASDFVLVKSLQVERFLAESKLDLRPLALRVSRIGTIACNSIDQLLKDPYGSCILVGISGTFGIFLTDSWEYRFVGLKNWPRLKG
jgi:hypothetical protein